MHRAVLLSLFVLATPTLAQEAPADAPRAIVLMPEELPAYTATRGECFRWDRARRNWTATGVVTGALATTGGLVSALGSVGEDRTARVAVAISSAVLAAVGALAAYESGEYAAIYRERCMVLVR